MNAILAFRTLYLSDTSPERESLRCLFCIVYPNHLGGNSLSFTIPSCASDTGTQSCSGRQLLLSYRTRPLAIARHGGQICEYELACTGADRPDAIDIFVFGSAGDCRGLTTVRCPG